nr:MAG TPA: hypothetical protein [Caudoviricetes sp.]
MAAAAALIWSLPGSLPRRSLTVIFSLFSRSHLREAFRWASLVLNVLCSKGCTSFCILLYRIGAYKSA